ncbi:hypothetical protein N7491_004327 [Penicillium cf. griseofulvum]|uniref:Uncharacterized protein n=1 Tax=Penicillium cf. griseofulvum TaxID=2972120 RepID=A0A9W9M3N9_9EURO|nr:hypothetical protein N7472_007019 [Penicillium cf. griseofulvum]KAJ5423049.1 hypothetical protein N7445_011157 [Penicillium cf. griseofulvum]KAJ5433732.1 hypothetical protein N7491_004327 [Penicillium cf. griseofulvum]
MEYPGLAIFLIPASIRRRLPRLYSSRAESNGDQRHGLASLSEPQLLCHSELSTSVAPEIQRPSTASDDVDLFDSGSVRSDSREGMSSPTKYDTESGLRWNRVVPAFNLLRNAGYEAQQPQPDGRLTRSLYVNALVYLLDALPSDLTDEETSMLQRHIPEPVKAGLTTYPQPPGYMDGTNHKISPQPRSYLHKILASIIVQLFILLRLLLPYAKVFILQLYEYERAHRITERLVTTTLEAADGLGKGSINLGAAVCKFNEGRVGAAISNFAAWWMEGIAGGIYEGVGEGMAMSYADRS